MSVTSQQCGECLQKQAVKYCRNCEVDFCDDCETSVHKFRFNRDHQRVASTEKWLFQQLTCQAHQSQPILLFCVSCDKSICLHCKDEVLGTHKSHNVQKIEDVVEEKKKTIHELLKNCSAGVEATQELVNNLTSILEDFKTNLARKKELVDIMKRVVESASSTASANGGMEASFLAVWDRVQSSMKAFRQVSDSEFELCKRTKQICDADKMNASEFKAKQFEWGRHGNVFINGLELSGTNANNFFPAMRKDPVLVEEKAGLRDCWEAVVVSSAANGHTCIGIGDANVPLDSYLSSKGRSLRFIQSGGPQSCDPEILGCIKQMTGSFSYEVGDTVGLMIDCCGSPVLRGFVNRKQVCSMPFPCGTWYPAFCVYTGKMVITEMPRGNEWVCD
eukprot:TRINITY_DN29177_c0_g1_i1.p1 TRINITY_DN29177_c0_g1~~TRINITY_DN29177_c0_g1_i1.p1  ORF type:complete len:413 (-),score=95.48 TRINITY_DN29177_c0_g1_i1:606-1775(-)